MTCCLFGTMPISKPITDLSSHWSSVKHSNISNEDTVVFIPWWRHQMETFSALLALCAGNSHRWIPIKQASDAEFFFHLRLNKRLFNNGEAGYLRRHRAHYDAIVIQENGVEGNSVCISVVTMRQAFWSTLLQVTACLLFDSKLSLVPSYPWIR